MSKARTGKPSGFFSASMKPFEGFRSVSFTLDGAEYTLMTEAPLSADALCAMAGELIAAHDR